MAKPTQLKVHYIFTIIVYFRCFYTDLKFLVMKINISSYASCFGNNNNTTEMNHLSFILKLLIFLNIFFQKDFIILKFLDIKIREINFNFCYFGIRFLGGLSLHLNHLIA